MFSSSSAQPEKEPMSGGQSTPLAKILVCEDNAGLRQVLAELLSRAGYSVCLKDEAEAESTLDSNTFDLVITSIKIPGLRGIAGLRIARQASQDSNKIEATAHPVFADLDSGLWVGIDAYIAKPFHPSELLSAVRRLLQSDRRPSKRRDN